MKKLLSFTLTLLMVLTMTGCGSSSPAGEPDKPEPQKEVEFGLGTVENGVHKNEFLGIGLKMKQAGMHEVDNGNSNYRTKIKPEDLDAVISRGLVVELLCQSYEGNEFVRDSFNWIMSIEAVKDVNKTIEPKSFMTDKRTSRVKSASENYTDLLPVGLAVKMSSKPPYDTDITFQCALCTHNSDNRKPVRELVARMIDYYRNNDLKL